MTHTPEHRAVGEGSPMSIQWPDRSHRTLAEVWRLSAEDVKAEQFVDLRPQDWRKA